MDDRQVEAACRKYHGVSWDEYSDYARRIDRDRMRAAIDEAVSLRAVGDVVCIPREPTEEMIDAAQSNATGGLITREARAAIFRAMAAASPAILAADSLIAALRHVGRFGCTNYTSGSCRDVGSGRSMGAEYAAEAWCDACVSISALGQ